MITPPELAVLTGGNEALAEKWVEPLNAAMAEFEINTDARAAAFLAQLAHESGGFATLEEGLYYKTADRLRAVWPRRFGQKSDAELQPYLRNSRALASSVYANRMGNGDEASGDGYAFRGRGLIQLTGRDNYRAASEGLGIDLVTDPDAMLEPITAARVAAWYWREHGCNELADAGNFGLITERINGGRVGMDDRLAKLGLITGAMVA